MKLKKGDNVIIKTGKDKGKKGKIVRVLVEENKVIIDIKKAFAEFLVMSDKANLYMDCPEPRKIAGGILKMCQIVHPDLIWAPINYSGKDLQVTIKNFHVMPKV